MSNFSDIYIEITDISDKTHYINTSHIIELYYSKRDSDRVYITLSNGTPIAAEISIMQFEKVRAASATNLKANIN